MKSTIIYGLINLGVLIGSSLTVSSCASEQNMPVENERIITVAYEKSTQRFEEINSMLQTCEFGEIEGKHLIVAQIESALSEFNTTDIELFLSQNNVSLDVFDACCFYSENISSPDVFERMTQFFPELTMKDFEQVFDIYYISKIVENSVMMSRAGVESNIEHGDVMDNASAQKNKLSTGCIVAVSGAVVSCVSAVAIGNVAGLAWWLASYSFSLAGVVTSCS